MDRFAEIRQILCDELAIEETQVVPEAHLQDDLGADSLALLNLAEAIAARYGIALLGDDLVDLENVAQLMKLVDTKIAASG